MRIDLERAIPELPERRRERRGGISLSTAKLLSCGSLRRWPCSPRWLETTLRRAIRPDDSLLQTTTCSYSVQDTGTRLGAISRSTALRVPRLPVHTYYGVFSTKKWRYPSIGASQCYDIIVLAAPTELDTNSCPCPAPQPATYQSSTFSLCYSFPVSSNTANELSRSRTR